MPRKPAKPYDPEKLRSAAAVMGSLGGRSGIGKSKSRGTEVARKAALARWRKTKEKE